VPPADAQKIDVSSRIRSTSFGHKTWLVLAPDGTRFWIEWGKSTNRPGALFGPFSIAASGGTGGSGGSGTSGSTGDKDKPAPDAGAPSGGKPFPRYKQKAPLPEGDGPKPAPPPPVR